MSKINLYDSIISPVITEKATSLSEKDKVVFKVNINASKISIKKNIEKIFKVNVIKVNTIKVKPKTEFKSGRKIKLNSFKKAVVTLKKGQSIDLSTGL